MPLRLCALVSLCQWFSMRIAIDARYVADHFPGIGRYVYNLVVGLAELDHRHTLVVLHNPALLNTRHPIDVLARFANVELVAAPARPFTLAEQVAIPRLLRRVRADLYHAPYYVRPYAGLPCPALVTLYDAIPRLFPSEVSPRARLLFDLLTRLAIRTSRQVLAISHSARDDLIAAYGLPAGRITVTPLAADPRFWPQPPEEIAAVRAKYGLPEGYVLSLASNKPHKNLAGLVEAFAQVLQITELNLQSAIYNLQLVVAGHWDPRYPQAHELAAKLGIADRVRFLPEVAEGDVPALYSGAAVFAFPSLYEGFGLPPLEALACGAAVLCCDTSSLPEVVGNAALRVAPTVEALSAGLTALLGDDALRAKLRAAARGRAALFSWRRTAELTLAAYEQVMDRS
jgi:glycosyltransferase involved in cell wall biosynthesis